MRPRRFDLIAFDWDGTLFDSTRLITRSIQAAVRDVGGREPSAEQASYVIGMGLMQALAHAAPDVAPEHHERLCERYRHHYLQRQHEISLFDGVLPLLADLKSRHHWLTVATGKSRRGLDETLRHVELQGMFDGSRTADEMSHAWIAVTHLDDAGYARLKAEREAKQKATTNNVAAQRDRQ